MTAMQFDIMTLSVLQGTAWMVFALTTFVMARVHPKEAHLRDWTLGALLCLVGSVAHAVSQPALLFVSTVVGNTLLCVGGAVLYVALRGLLGQSRPLWVPWMVLCVGAPLLAWGTYVQPSFSYRVVVVSLLFAAPLAASVWAVWRNPQTRRRGPLQWVNGLMLLVLAGGTAVFTWRTLYAAYNLAEIKSIFASSPLYAAPYLWCILYNVWLPIAIALTVSERLQRDLTTARDVADAHNKAKSRFLATMSHEIRTPMNGMLGMAQLLQQPAMDAAARQEAAQIIVDSGGALLTLLNDILDLSKIEAGKIELTPAPFAPHRLVREVETLFAQSAHDKGLRLHATWTGSPGSTYVADAMRLRQMLSNLTSNAVKFTRRGEVHIEARALAQTATGAVLEFAVADTGIGLSAEQGSRLFKPFAQADDSITREYGGSGLGLSIVRQLARSMGGDAGFDSQPGQGARFWFSVQVGVSWPHGTPSQPETANPSASLSSTLTPTPTSPPQPLPTHHSATVLVAEDNAINRVVITALLERMGLTPLMAEDGHQAAEQLAQLQVSRMAPALVLMDMQMPVLDGLAATERIRAWESAHHHARVPIVALTANAYAEDRHRCLAAGMDDFLAKPVNYAQLQALVARWIPARSSVEPDPVFGRPDAGRPPV